MSYAVDIVDPFLADEQLILTEHALSILPEPLFWTGVDDHAGIPTLILGDEYD